MKRRIGFFKGKPLVIGDSNIVTDNEILAKKQKDGKVELSYKNNGVLQSITGSGGKGNFPEDYMITVQGFDSNAIAPQITESFCCKQSDGILYAINKNYNSYNESVPTEELDCDTIKYSPYSYLIRSSGDTFGYHKILISGTENNKIINSIDKMFSATTDSTGDVLNPLNSYMYTQSGRTYIQVYRAYDLLVGTNKDNKVIFMYLLDISNWGSNFGTRVSALLKNAGLEIDYNIDYQ